MFCTIKEGTYHLGDYNEELDIHTKMQSAPSPLSTIKLSSI